MIRVFVVILLMLQSGLLKAQSIPVKDIDPSFELGETYVSWRVDDNVTLSVLGMGSSIHSGRGINKSKEQKLEMLHPAWDFFGVINRVIESRYLGHEDLYYVEAVVSPSVSLSVYQVYSDELKLESIAVNGYLICNERKNNYCRSVYLSSDLIEVEIDSIYHDLLKGEPLKVELVYNDSNSEGSSFKYMYLLNSGKVSEGLNKSLLKGGLDATSYNEKVDKDRADVVFSAKVTYFLYFISLITAFIVLYNRDYFSFLARNLFRSAFGMLNLIFKYPKKFVSWLRGLVLRKDSFLTKSEGFTKVSVSEELLRWIQLRDSNVISEEEFNLVKKKLLETLRDNESKK